MVRDPTDRKPRKDLISTEVLLLKDLLKVFYG